MVRRRGIRCHVREGRITRHGRAPAFIAFSAFCGFFSRKLRLQKVTATPEHRPPPWPSSSATGDRTDDSPSTAGQVRERAVVTSDPVGSPRSASLRRSCLERRSHEARASHDHPRRMKEDKVKKFTAVSLLLATALALTFAPAASAHNRAHITLPDGKCIIVGSEKSVSLPDGTLLDLRPETSPADEIGTAFAAEQGNSALNKGACP